MDASRPITAMTTNQQLDKRESSVLLPSAHDRRIHYPELLEEGVTALDL
jgi:hypothetical protein